jgi:hypothetical protein
MTAFMAKVASGDGVLGRFGGSLVLAPADSTIVDAVLDLAREADASHPAAPGRFLPRKVAGIVSQSDDAPTLAIVSAVEDGLAVLLVGDVTMTLVDATGTTTLSGLDATTWVDRIVRGAWTSLTLSLSGSGAVQARSDFQGGVVTAGGAALLPAGGPVAAPVVAAPVAAAVVSAPAPVLEPVADLPLPVADLPLPVAEPAVVEPPVVEPPVVEPPVAEPLPVDEPETAGMELPAVTPAEAPAFQSISLDLPDDEPLDNAPLPVLDVLAAGATMALPAVTAPAAEAEAAGATVQGIECSRQHFNDPTSIYCAVCGISMVHQTHNLVSGPRPPLGVIVLDDGSVFSLDGDYVLGREPDHADEVVSGSATALTLEDPDTTMSRVHAKLLLVGWDVQLHDANSANGTYSAKPGDTEWTKLTPGTSVILKPGAKVALGGRTLVFDSHHKL